MARYSRTGLGFLNQMKVRPKHYSLVIAWLLISASAEALETDQFYAWGQPIEDSTEYLNAWVRVQIQSALDSRAGDASLDCEAAVKHVQKKLQHSIYQPIELWIISTDLVDRIPRGLEESRDYRKNYLLGKTIAFDFARWLQPSPTLQVNGIRIGSDKLAHFFSEGWWYYKWWKKHNDDYSPKELQRRLLQYGVDLEWWVQGMLVTGIFSLGDMESNYQGFVFYHQLCHGDEPLLYQQQGRWFFSENFDFRNYVYPEWDESWNANIYGQMRWKHIRSTMATYCPMLHSPWVEQQRERYSELDTQTPTEELVMELVAAGELPDPKPFDITSVCN